MKRRSNVTLLCILTICVALISPFTRPSSVSAKALETPSADQLALLSAVCENDVSGTTCRTCPSYTEGTPGTDISVGPFLANVINWTPNNAYVGLSGCQETVYGHKGAVLLDRDGDRWKVIRYDAEIAIDDCGQFPPPIVGTAYFVCKRQYGNRNHDLTSLDSIWVQAKKTTVANVITLGINQGSCAETVDDFVLESWTHGSIEADFRVGVAETHARRAPSSEQCPAITQQGKTVHYTLNFRRRGNRFRAQGKSIPLVACITRFVEGKGVPGRYCKPPT